MTAVDEVATLQTVSPRGGVRIPDKLLEERALHFQEWGDQRLRQEARKVLRRHDRQRFGISESVSALNLLVKPAWVIFRGRKTAISRAFLPGPFLKEVVCVGNAASGELRTDIFNLPEACAMDHGGRRAALSIAVRGMGPVARAARMSIVAGTPRRQYLFPSRPYR